MPVQPLLRGGTLAQLARLVKVGYWNGPAVLLPHQRVMLGGADDQSGTPCPTNQSRPLPRWASISASIRSTSSASIDAARLYCSRSGLGPYIGVNHARSAARMPCPHEPKQRLRRRGVANWRSGPRQKGRSSMPGSGAVRRGSFVRTVRILATSQHYVGHNTTPAASGGETGRRKLMATTSPQEL